MFEDRLVCGIKTTRYSLTPPSSSLAANLSDMLRCCATLVQRTRLHMCLYSLVSHNTFLKKTKNLLAVAVWSKAETPFPQRKVFTAIWLHFLEPSSSSKTAAALAYPLISSAAATVCKLVFSPTSCSCSSVCLQSADWLHNNK